MTRHLVHPTRRIRLEWTVLLAEQGHRVGLLTYREGEPLPLLSLRFLSVVVAVRFSAPLLIPV